MADIMNVSIYCMKRNSFLHEKNLKVQYIYRCKVEYKIIQK